MSNADEDDKAAGVHQQRRAVRKHDERRVALPDVEKRDVQPAVAARRTSVRGSTRIHSAAATATHRRRARQARRLGRRATTDHAPRRA